MGKHKPPKKGENKALSISHPNSRKAKAFAKKIIKNSHRQKTKMDHLVKRTLLVTEKFMWFKENLEGCSECTAYLLDQLFDKYISRFDEELEQIRIKHTIGQRKNRQHASREDIIIMTKNRETEEYNTCGIDMVDILNPKQFKLFMKWDGNPSIQFKIRRFSKPFLQKYKPPAVSKPLSENPPTNPENSTEEKVTEDSPVEENMMVTE